MKRTLRIALPVAIVTAIAVFLATRPERARVIGSLPDRIADTTFWRMFSELSEPDGNFHSNNFVSNETELQHVIPPLQKIIAPGGVYLGVGPEQNLTYAVAFRPKVAFILDIRRQNAMMHLMYKSLIEAAPTRVDFLTLLCSRRPGIAVDTTATASLLVAAFSSREPLNTLRDSAMGVIINQLRKVHQFPISDEDLASIEFVHGAFYESGIDLTYSSNDRYRLRAPSRMMPTFALLMAESDGMGSERGFLASEASYRALRDMEQRNVIVPVVGDFAGPKALRGIGHWVAERGATVSVYYLSNVEQYLFQSDAWKRFYENVQTLPRDSSSTFIRSVANGRRTYQSPPRLQIAQQYEPINGVVNAYRKKRVKTYGDITRMGR